MRQNLAIAFALVALLAAGCGSSSKSSQSTSQTTTTTSAGPGSASTLAPIHGHYAPSIDPGNFVSTIDNPRTTPKIRPIVVPAATDRVANAAATIT